MAALAAAYHRRLLHLAARDLTGSGTRDEVAEELADLAAAVLEAALAVARAELITARGGALPPGAEPSGTGLPGSPSSPWASAAPAS